MTLSPLSDSRSARHGRPSGMRLSTKLLSRLNAEPMQPRSREAGNSTSTEGNSRTSIGEVPCHEAEGVHRPGADSRRSAVSSSSPSARLVGRRSEPGHEGDQPHYSEHRSRRRRLRIQTAQPQ
jgi:hypothetical protein